MRIRIGVSPYQRAIEVGRRGAGRPAVAHLPFRLGGADQKEAPLPGLNKKSSSSSCLFRQTKPRRRPRFRRRYPLRLRGRNRAFGWVAVAAGRASARRRPVVDHLGRVAGHLGRLAVLAGYVDPTFVYSFDGSRPGVLGLQFRRSFRRTVPASGSLVCGTDRCLSRNQRYCSKIVPVAAISLAPLRPKCALTAAPATALTWRYFRRSSPMTHDGMICRSRRSPRAPTFAACTPSGSAATLAKRPTLN
jgi:hypothetical protein